MTRCCFKTVRRLGGLEEIRDQLQIEEARSHEAHVRPLSDGVVLRDSVVLEDPYTSQALKKESP